MSSPPPYADGGYDGRDPQGPPAVYLPQTAQAPAYDAYTDPATAHGWQNAYDETRELPPTFRDQLTAWRLEVHRGQDCPATRP